MSDAFDDRQEEQKLPKPSQPYLFEGGITHLSEEDEENPRHEISNEKSE